MVKKIKLVYCMLVVFNRYYGAGCCKQYNSYKGLVMAGYQGGLMP